MNRRFQFSLGTLLMATFAIGLLLLPVSLAMSAPLESWAVIEPVVIVCSAFGLIVLGLSMIQGEPSVRRTKSKWKTKIWPMVVLTLMVLLAAGCIMAVVFAPAIVSHFLFSMCCRPGCPDYLFAHDLG